MMSGAMRATDQIARRHLMVAAAEQLASRSRAESCIEALGL